jgi:hypothetical protein
MPYEITFRKPVKVENESIYINECCWGGDIVRTALLPIVDGKCADVFTLQEDWGWFIWFKKSDLQMEINITTDSKEGDFRIHVCAERASFFRRKIVEDTSDVHELAAQVTERLREWAGNVEGVRTDSNFIPVQ